MPRPWARPMTSARTRARSPRASRSGRGARWPRAGVSLAQPHARVRRLHRIAHGVHEIRADRVEIDLLAEACAEVVEGTRGVIARSVEAAVDGPLHAAPKRLEQRDARERG